jgi:hypothetical protein
MDLEAEIISVTDTNSDTETDTNSDIDTDTNSDTNSDIDTEIESDTDDGVKSSGVSTAFLTPITQLTPLTSTTPIDASLTDITPKGETIGDLIGIKKEKTIPPPPIPSSMKQPSPVKITLQKPLPDIKITTKTQQSPQPVEFKTVQLKTPKNPPTQVSLDDMLVQRKDEKEDHFNMRSIYSKVAMRVFKGAINPATAVLIGEMAVNKAIYGVTYPEESDNVIKYVDSEIMKM